MNETFRKCEIRQEGGPVPEFRIFDKRFPKYLVRSPKFWARISAIMDFCVLREILSSFDPKSGTGPLDKCYKATFKV